MKNKIDARIVRSQQALLKAGMELLNVNKDANISDIAIHANVGRATVYRQFENREKLIKSIAFYCLERFDEATAPIDKEAKSSLDAIRLLFKYAMPLTQEFQYLANLEHLADEDQEILDIFEKQKQQMFLLVDMGKKEGSICKSFPSSWVVNLIDGIFFTGWLQQKEKQNSIKEISDFAFKSLQHGINTQTD